MAKKPIQIYVRVPVDQCTKQVGLMCGAKEARHPMNQSGYYHEFQGGSTRFVYPTDADRRKIYEQLKDEFDG